MPVSQYSRVALINPRWDFEGSRYWACGDTHLPLELMYSQTLLKQAGVEAVVIDAHLEQLSPAQVAGRVATFAADLVVFTTAPSYLFWRCPPPELDIPARLCELLRGAAPLLAIGPHGSATPRYAMETLGCDAVIRGEPEEELLKVVLGQPHGATLWKGTDPSEQVEVARTDPALLPALDYAEYPMHLRTHRHHVFWGDGRGAEVEFSRGCPYLCSFCNRRFFRSRYRERPVERVLEEMCRLRDMGINYVYFIDEVFGLPGSEPLLRALEASSVLQFGCQTRIDLWDESRFDRLAAAGCISVEMGLESPLPETQRALRKGYALDGERMLQLMLYAKSKIQWVQGDLVRLPGEDAESRRAADEWRKEAIGRGVWVSEPVDLFLYPGCDLHDQLIGPIDDQAWIRAQQHDKHRTL